jgi:putative ABC transport system permease protein
LARGTGVCPTANREKSLPAKAAIGVLALAFGGLAALLAGIGLYGVLAYTTMQRTRGIGIRIALGSTCWPSAT